MLEQRRGPAEMGVPPMSWLTPCPCRPRPHPPQSLRRLSVNPALLPSPPQAPGRGAQAAMGVRWTPE